MLSLLENPPIVKKPKVPICKIFRVRIRIINRNQRRQGSLSICFSFEYLEVGIECRKGSMGTAGLGFEEKPEIN